MELAGAADPGDSKYPVFPKEWRRRMLSAVPSPLQRSLPRTTPAVLQDPIPTASKRRRPSSCRRVPAVLASDAADHEPLATRFAAVLVSDAAEHRPQRPGCMYVPNIIRMEGWFAFGVRQHSRWCMQTVCMSNRHRGELRAEHALECQGT